MNKYSDKSDFEINVLVARWELMKITLFPVTDAKYSEEKEAMVYLVDGKWSEAELFDYCNDPSDAMPIINEYGISLIYQEGEFQFATNDGNYHSGVSNPLKAAMIIFLMMKGAENETSSSNGDVVIN